MKLERQKNQSLIETAAQTPWDSQCTLANHPLIHRVNPPADQQPINHVLSRQTLWRYVFPKSSREFLITSRICERDSCENVSSSSICREFLRASQKGDVNLVKELASKHCVSDWTKYRHEVSGDTPLHLAAREGHLEVTKLLCEWWKEPSFRTEVANKDMKRPLHEAAQFARPEVLAYLIDKDAEIDPLKRADWTPLMLACTKPGPEAARCVKLLLNRGAALNLRNKDGWTPLLIACRAGNIDAVRMMIENSPRCIDARSKNGRSALHVAAFHGHEDVIDLLLMEDPSLMDCKDSSGSTPLLESIKSGDLKTVKNLIEHGANFHTVDKMGQNILHYAAQAGDSQIIKFILNNRLVDVDARASFDITPLMLAEKNKRLEAIEILSSSLNDGKTESQ